MKERRVWTKWFYWFTFAVAIIIIYKTLDNFTEIKNGIGNFLHIIMPFILGIIMSYVLYIPVRNFEKLLKKIKKIKFIQKKARVLSVIIVYLLALIILTLVINYILPIICTSVIDFVNHFQDYYRQTTLLVSSL